MRRWLVDFAILVSTLTFTGSSVHALGYYLGREELYRWGNAVAIAPNTVLWIQLLSLGLLTLAVASRLKNGHDNGSLLIGKS